MEILPTIKDRILYFAKNQEDAIQDFFIKTGLKYSNFTGKSKKSDLQSKSVAEILPIYPQLNIEWLLTGNGEMLKEIAPKAPLSQIQEYEEKIRLLENTIKDKEKIISLQEKQLNYTKKGDFELPPLSMVAEEQEESHEINVLKDKKRKKDTPHNTLNRTE